MSATEEFLFPTHIFANCGEKIEGIFDATEKIKINTFTLAKREPNTQKGKSMGILPYLTLLQSQAPLMIMFFTL